MKIMMAVLMALMTGTPAFAGGVITMPYAEATQTGLTGAWTVTVPCHVSGAVDASVVDKANPLPTKVFGADVIVVSDGSGGWEATFSFTLTEAGTYSVKTKSKGPWHLDFTSTDLDTYDTSNNGTLSLAEFTTIGDTQYLTSIGDTFAEADADDDGELTLTELNSIIDPTREHHREVTLSVTKP